MRVGVSPCVRSSCVRHHSLHHGKFFLGVISSQAMIVAYSCLLTCFYNAVLSMGPFSYLTEMNHVPFSRWQHCTLEVCYSYGWVYIAF